jgi:hypothetical protein
MSQKIKVPKAASPKKAASANKTARTGVTKTTYNEDTPEEVRSSLPIGGRGNGTVYKNDPVIGGVTEIILNDIYVRSPVRIERHLDDYRAALRSAEMRQYPNRTRLYDIYADILLDGHLWGVINKRLLTVLNQQLFYADADGEEVDDMRDVIKSSEFRKICRTILETQFWGISGLEFIPGPEIECRVIPRKHIHPKTQIISIEQNVQTDGFDYTRLDNVWVIGEPEDVGILNQCAPLILYKRGALADWANFIEIFGMPVRVFRYDPLDPGTEEKLKNLVDEEGNLLAIVIPKTADLEIVDGKTSNANGDLQDKFLKMLDGQVSIVVLGNTETTSNSGTGSQAKSKTHSDQQKELIKADIVYLENFLNDPHFIKILQSYGCPVVEGGRFNIKSEVDIAYAAEKVLIDTTLVQSGLDIGKNYFYETYNIPAPGPEDEILKAPAAPGPSGQPGADNPGNDMADVVAKLKLEIIAGMKDFFA